MSAFSLGLDVKKEVGPLIVNAGEAYLRKTIEPPVKNAVKPAVDFVVAKVSRS